MSKKSVVAREFKRIRMVRQQGQKREDIKKLLTAEYAKENCDYDRIEEFQLKLNKMPRNSSKCRIRKRCNCCGRPRAVYRRFGLCRICLRNNLNNGDVCGATKSSW